MNPAQLKQAIEPADLRRQLEEVDAQLKRAMGGAEIRRLNARRRVLEKKMLKVTKRTVRRNDGHGLKPHQIA